jgi:hypothetical protein
MKMKSSINQILKNTVESITGKLEQPEERTSGTEDMIEVILH